MKDIETLRSEVRKKYHASSDALIDVAHAAKISPSTVWNFIQGITSVPTFLTRWGLQKYVEG